MLRVVEAVAMAFGILLILSFSANAQDASLRERILHPIGTPARPILLRPSTSKETVPGFPALPISSWITFSDFMRRVEESNLSLAAQRYNVPIAQAQLTAASVFPDPSLQGGYSGDASGSGQESAYSGSLSQEVLLGGKLRYRKDAARAALLASSATLSDFLRNVREQAAEAFIDGLTNLLILNCKEESLKRAHQLVEVQVERLRMGEAPEDALMRARVAELEAHSTLADSESDFYESLSELVLLIGVSAGDGLIAPQGDLKRETETFSLTQLVERAVTSRSDVLAADYTQQRARAGYQLAKAARVPDVTIAGTYTHFSRITNPIDPAPAWENVGVSFSLPIPISALNDGAVQAAYYQELQAEETLQAAKLQAESDVRRAYQRYVLANQEVQLFDAELLKDSAQIYKSRLFKMEKGQMTLLDVLDAHQALLQLYLDYYNALSRRAKALVELEQAAGIWDVDF
jgi:outer membrane protein, heavy metal efflux system